MPRTGVMLSHTPVRAALQDIRILHMLLDVKPNLRLVLLKVFGMSGLGKTAAHVQKCKTFSSLNLVVVGEGLP